MAQALRSFDAKRKCSDGRYTHIHCASIIPPCGYVLTFLKPSIVLEEKWEGTADTGLRGVPNSKERSHNGLGFMPKVVISWEASIDIVRCQASIPTRGD